MISIMKDFTYLTDNIEIIKFILYLKRYNVYLGHTPLDDEGIIMLALKSLENKFDNENGEWHK